MTNEEYDAALQEYLEVALTETFSKPGTADVTPEDKKKLKGILEHYAKMAHPFTACKRDQIKHGLSPEHANRRCAVIKDIIRGTTKWRSKEHNLSAEDVIWLDPIAVMELGETTSLNDEKTGEEGALNDTNDTRLSDGTDTAISTGTSAATTSITTTTPTVTTTSGTTTTNGGGVTITTPQVAELALKVGSVAEWGEDSDSSAKAYGLVTEVDATNQQARVVPLEIGAGGMLVKSGADAVMKDMDNIRASSKTLTESIAWPQKAQENAVLGMWMARSNGRDVPQVAVDLSDGGMLDEEQVAELSRFFDVVCGDEEPGFDCSWAEYQMHGGDAAREWLAELSDIAEALALELAEGYAKKGEAQYGPGTKVQWKGPDGETLVGTVVRVLEREGTSMCLVRTPDGATVTVPHSSLSRATSGNSGSSDTDNEGDLADAAYEEVRDSAERVLNPLLDFSATIAQLPIDLSEATQVTENLWRKHILPYGKVHYKGKVLDFSKNFAKQLVSTFQQKPFDSVPFINVDGHNQHNSDPERVRGEVKNLELGDDGVYALVETNEKGTEYLKKVNPKLGTSARLRFDWKRPADNKYFGPVLEHLAGTTLPHVPGLKPFTPADLSLVDMNEQPGGDAAGAGGVEDLTACSFEEEETGGDPVAGSVETTPTKEEEVSNLSTDGSNTVTTDDVKNALDTIDLSDFAEDQRPAIAALIKAHQEKDAEAKKAYDLAEQAMSGYSQQKQELHNERIKGYINERASAGVLPVVVKSAEALLMDMSLADKELTIDLSDDGSGEETTHVHGLVRKILDNYPTEMKYGEDGQADLTQEPDSDDALIARWEAFRAEQNGTPAATAKGGE